MSWSETTLSGWSETTLSGWSLYLLLWLFVVYSFLGVVIETLFCLFREGVLESRLGLLYLPLRPMYGFGGVACTLLLDRFQHQPLLVFLGGMAICSVVEYLAGSICDTAFGTLSWDYRTKPLQLHGKICLEYSCYWGLLAGLAVYILSPTISTAIGEMDRTAGENVLTAVVALTVVSTALTTVAWTRAARRLATIRLTDDHRAAHLPATAPGRFVDLLVPDPVLINTFPRTRLARELMVHTGRQRLWIMWPPAGERTGT